MHSGVIYMCKLSGMAQKEECDTVKCATTGHFDSEDDGATKAEL